MAFVQAPPSGLATLFNNPTYSTIFSTFSPPRLFTPIGSNITDVTFFVPGSAGAIPATVSAFGAVFTNVNLANTSRLQFFDQNNVQLLSCGCGDRDCANRQPLVPGCGGDRR